MVFVSSLGNMGLLWIVLAAVLLLIPKYRRLGIVLTCGLVIELVLCNLLLKPIVARPRPCDLNAAVDLLVHRPNDWSFPSGHTTAAFTAASAFYFSKNRLWIAVGVLAVLIAFSRLYLYVHFPTDVLAGVVLGTLSGFLGAVAVGRFEKRKKRQ